MYLIRVILVVLFIVLCGVHGLQGEFNFVKCRNFKIFSPILETKIVSSTLQCSTLCSTSSTCMSVNVCRQGNQITCQLSSFYPDACSGLDPDVNCNTLYLYNPCRNNGVYTPSNGTCTCSKPYVGDLCERIAYNCKEIHAMYNLPNSVRDEIIQPVGQGQILNVNCVQAKTEACRVLQFAGWPKPTLASTWEDFRFRRTDANTMFAGTDVLHVITNSQPYDLRVFAGPPMFTVYYRGFRVKSEQNNYAFEYDSFDCAASCSSVIDGLATVMGEPFSTTDRDVYNCVNASGHCWWFNTDCGPVSLSNPLYSYVPTWPENATQIHQMMIFSGNLLVV